MVSLPAHERIRWSWVTPKTPVPVCLCGSQCEVVDGTCVRCRYEKYLATRINDRIYDIYYEKDAAGRFVNQRFVWDAVHRYARVDGRPLADDILDDLYNKCWQQVTAALPRYKEQKDAKQSTWLYQICRFTVLKYLRDEGRRVKRELKHGLTTVPLNETAAPLHHTRAPIGMDSAKYAPPLSLVDQETAEWLARGYG